MVRRFDLVDESDRIIFHRNAALACCIDDKPIGSEAEFASALAWLKKG